jgi:hypothetical protein
MGICKGITKSGKKCKQKTKKDYCRFHFIDINDPKPLKNKEKNNNEIEGNSFEVAICEIKNIPYQDKIQTYRYHRDNVNEIKDFLNTQKLPELTKYIGNNIINGKKSKIDFIDKNEKTYSLKSNKTNKMICPQVIGQASTKTFCEYFRLEKLEVFEIKEFIHSNISKIIQDYWKNLFCCDYLIWIQRDKKKKFTLNIYEKENMLNKFLNLDPKMFSWTRKLEYWNESNTLKYNNESLAEFQIHNHRNCIKMRFNGNFIIKKDLWPFNEDQKRKSYRISSKKIM